MEVRRQKDKKVSCINESKLSTNSFESNSSVVKKEMKSDMALNDCCR